ncbi:MAG TPA: F0F1 ATP synthase subunit B [Candidatus Polarisedimenticolaceae bacterium]|nr:F0F1 ATP synthase subunit B [Candidatus Polarisedimenticolaceae bacterium]
MPIPVLLAAESHSQGLGALGINLPALLFEIINFAILFWILKRYAYKPILNALENRRKTIENSLKAAEEARAEKASIEKQRAEILAKAKSHAAELISEARMEAETKKNAIISEAETTAVHIVEQAKRETTRQLEAARKELAHEARKLVIAATSRLIGEKLDEKRDAELLEKAFETAGGRRG